MSREEMVIRLAQMHNEFEMLRLAAEDNRMPTAITMGLAWLRDDALKVIADLDPDFEMPED
jgi:hypothetical protein